MENEQENKKAFEILGIEFFVLIILGIILLLILNYLNIFSLSKMYPSLFGFLPHIEEQGNNTNEAVSVVEQEPPPRNTLPFISCPVAKGDCIKGEPFVEETEQEVVYGVRFSNLEERQVFAVAAGSKEQNNNTISIENAGRNIRAEYVLSPGFEFDSAASGASSLSEQQLLGAFQEGAQSTLTLYILNLMTETYIKIGVDESGNFLTQEE